MTFPQELRYSAEHEWVRIDASPPLMHLSQSNNGGPDLHKGVKVYMKFYENGRKHT